MSGMTLTGGLSHRTAVVPSFSIANWGVSGSGSPESVKSLPTPLSFAVVAYLNLRLAIGVAFTNRSLPLGATRFQATYGQKRFLSAHDGYCPRFNELLPAP